VSAPRGISFHVPIAPVSVNRRYVGRTFRLSPEYRAFHAAVAMCAKRAMRGIQPLEGPLLAELTLLVNNARQDVDGPAKPCLDGCNGIVFADDSQVVELRIVKMHTPKPEAPGVTIAVRESA
jgi:Holliday junction resolvase RusA-like endonuclease